MFIPCPKCSQHVWLKTNFTCPRCGAVVRRCADCSHFDDADNLCIELGGNVDPNQAREPTRLSVSSGCQTYEPVTIALA
ncbi:MAG: hypothetical protein ACE5JM_01190 [Armatimonadota bacterium]